MDKVQKNRFYRIALYLFQAYFGKFLFFIRKQSPVNSAYNNFKGECLVFKTTT
jgi:hypothetical protein